MQSGTGPNAETMLAECIATTICLSTFVTSNVLFHGTLRSPSEDTPESNFDRRETNFGVRVFSFAIRIKLNRFLVICPRLDNNVRLGRLST